MFKESKRTDILLTIFVLAICVLIGGYAISKNKINLSDLNIISQIKQQILPDQNVSADDDNDGLTNSEEKKYGTDAAKRDTDGDGYSDGEEILSGYDPFKPAPDDELQNNSQSISQNLNKILSLKTSKNLIDGTIPLLNNFKNSPQLNLLTADLQTDISRLFALPEISASQLRIVTDNSEESIGNYLTAAQKIISKNFAPEQFGEPVAELISQSAQTRDYSGFKKYTQAYETSFNEIKNLSIPSSLAENHKKILSVLWFLKNTFDAIAQTSEDPMKALIAFQNLESVLNLLDKI